MVVARQRGGIVVAVVAGGSGSSTIVVGVLGEVGVIGCKRGAIAGCSWSLVSGVASTRCVLVSRGGHDWLERSGLDEVGERSARICGYKIL